MNCRHNHLLLAILLLILTLLPLDSNAQTKTFSGERISFDEGWHFKLGNAYSDHYEMHLYGKGFMPFSKTGRMRGINDLDFDDLDWREVDLPHDWAIELDFINDRSLHSHGFKPVGWQFPEYSLGWYRKTFEIPEEDLGKRISIKFDGVFRDCDVWLNGFYLGNNQTGYMEFMYDVTDMLQYGKENLLVLKVDATQYEGWWYEGAGIYRHTWLIKKSTLHIPEHGTYVTTDVNENKTTVNVQTDLSNMSESPEKCHLRLEVLDQKGNVVATALEKVRLESYCKNTVTTEITVSKPRLWSLESPYLYTLVSEIESGNKVIERTETSFGIRTVRFDPQKGLFLNGEHVKLKGACVHQDHAGVGVALPDRLQEYRIERLKSMGCNAYRSAHHPATPELLDACDRLGMLVVSENRLLSGGPEYLSQFKRLIKRDRNHPSVILWSIGNEEMNVQNTQRGKRVAETFKRLQQELDPSRLCTYGGNNGNQFEGINEVVDVRGFNYMSIADIDKYHSDHPAQPLIGSEEASTLCTRGQYFMDRERGFMSDYDKRENAVFDWCATAEEWWKFYAERDFLAGGFIWTGIDYRGEPSPYSWPCINSHFGVMDVCCFPKNNYYYYQAWWTDKVVLHLYPHWNWYGNEGETINVWAQTNCEEVELFLNGKTKGKRKVKKNSHVEWDVVYEPGVLEARGVKNGLNITHKVETTGPASKIVITPDRRTITADGKDVSILNITVLDREGREVPDADNFITFQVEGNGRIIGVGNGNPSSHEPDKILEGNYFRNLFNGKCQAILQSTKTPGNIRIRATADQLRTAEILLNSEIAD